MVRAKMVGRSSINLVFVLLYRQVGSARRYICLRRVPMARNACQNGKVKARAWGQRHGQWLWWGSGVVVGVAGRQLGGGW